MYQRLSLGDTLSSRIGSLPLCHEGYDLMTTTDDAAPIPILPPLTMPLEEAMRTQRALRRLRPDPVDDALVLRLIELALKAPTGRNAQNWEFVLVKDRAVKARFARLYRMAWGLYGRFGRRLTASDPNMQRQLVAVQSQVEHFADIPVLVVACLRGFRPVWPPVAVTSYYGSIHPSIQNLLLAARATDCPRCAFLRTGDRSHGSNP
jgi:nitroreductase